MANLTQNNSYIGNSGATLSNSQWMKLKANPVLSGKVSAPAQSTTPAATPPQDSSFLLGNMPVARDYTKLLPQMQQPNLDQYQKGTPQYESALNNMTRNYGKNIDIPLGTQFIPPLADEVVVPENYGTFAKPTTIQNDTEKLSWGTPQKPKIKSLSVDNGQGITSAGQYVTDEADKSLLVKTVRGANPVADKAILNGRPSYMYQVDHIIPLDLGGADTLSNRQVLSNTEHNIKSKAQAIPYTLYAAGEISLDQARIMSLQWKDHDLSDVPMPDDHGVIPSVGNKTGLEIAREMKNKWYDKPVTFKDVMAEIPNTAKHLGENTPILKDFNFGREFVKGFANQATSGFVPYEQGDNQEGTGGWIGGKLGQITGGVASFMVMAGVLKGAATAINAVRGISVAQAAKYGIGTAAKGVTSVVAEDAAGAAVKGATTTTFSTLNNTPGYVSRMMLDKELQMRVAKSAGLSVVSGQVQQFVANKLNPYTLSGQQEVRDQATGELIGNVFRDLTLGAAFGLPSPTLKGVAQATALPLAIGLWMNPDDPTAALVDGVAFGAMHYMGARKNVGFNDITSLGGKKFRSPVLDKFNNAVDETMYSSLSNYAPEIMPVLGKGESIPAQYRTYEATQAAVNKSIESIVKRAFFGQATSPEIIQETVNKLKGFSKGINAKIDKFGETATEKTPGLFSSRKNKKAYTLSTEENKKILSNEFGKGYGKKTNFREKIDTGAMDLQEMLNEIKRVTVAARQLYKGGLVEELRGVADIDDLSSYTLESKKNRFIEQEKYVRPPVARQVVDTIDDSFMESSYVHFNEPSNTSSKLPSGTVAITGFGLGQNNPRVSDFLKLLEDPTTAKNISPNLIVVDRPETAPLWRLKNQFTDKKLIENGTHAIDSTPENAAQVFGVKWKLDANGNHMGKELVELGWIASEHRRQTGRNAFNQNPFVKKYESTGGAEGLRPIDFNKDDIISKMREGNMKVMVMNFDKSTSSTQNSGRSFIMGSVNDQNWIQSKLLNEKLSLQPNEDALSMSLARLKIVKSPQERAVLIRDIKEKNVDSAAERIPTLPATASRDVIAAVDSKRNAMLAVDKALDSATPQELKTKLLDDLGILVDDAKAQELFDNKTVVTEKAITDLIVDSVNNGKVTLEGRLAAEMIKKVDESGFMHNSDLGSISSELPVAGKKFNQNNTADLVKEIPANRNNPLATKQVESPISNLSERIVSESQSPLARNGSVVSKRKATQEEMTKEVKTNVDSSYRDLSERALNLIEEFNPQGGGQYVPIDPETGIRTPGRGAEPIARVLVEKVKRLEPKGVSKEDAFKIKEEITPQLNMNIAKRLRDVFSMPLEDAISLVEKVTTTPTPQDFIKKTITPTSSEDFFKKKDLTGKTLYDVLINRRQKSGGDVIRWAKTGIEKATPGTYGHSFSYSLDTLLKNTFGDNYAKDFSVKNILGRAFGTEGVAKNTFEELFTTYDKKNLGDEFSQPKDYINSLATGDKASKESIIKKDLNRTVADKNIEFSKEDLATIAEAGFTVDDGNSVGMGVKSPKDMDMLTGLSEADFSLLPGLTSIEMAGAPKEGASAVRKGVEDARNVMQFIIKAHNESVDNSKKFTGKTSLINKSKIFLTPSTYSGLYKNLTPEKKAEVNLNTDLYFDNIYRKYMDRLATRTSKQEKLKAETSSILKLNETYKTLLKASKTPVEDRPNWQTKEFIDESIKDILQEIKNIKNSSAKIVKKDGAGGPGFLGNLQGAWDALKKLGGKRNETSDKIFPVGKEGEDSFMTSQNSPMIPKHKLGIEEAIGDHETSIIPQNGKWVKPNEYEKYHFRNNYGENKALGYYQVTPETLFDESKKLLGRQVSPEEFLEKPYLQDMFATNRVKSWLGEGHSKNEIIKMWNVGKYGDTNSEKANTYLTKVLPNLRRD